MESYAAKLLSIFPEELPSPKGSISFGDLAALASIRNSKEYERSLQKLAKHLPYKTSSWPSFGEYIEDWYKVEVGDFKYQLLYCERGSCRITENCENLIDLSYQILNIASPNLTVSSVKASADLDQIRDQRLLIWLQMSSKIYYMLQTNKYFGARMLSANVTWMCEELVRMGIYSSTVDAFRGKVHIIKGLTLSGLPYDLASELYLELQNA
ncbi:hypothetical protein [Pseudomonas anguilliseptica]|uniref:hypothetical protein n=1 Tax=Pseudomonas anguilliseptica TaxID=53406 RepID=UPI0037360998